MDGVYAENAGAFFDRHGWRGMPKLQEQISAGGAWMARHPETKKPLFPRP
jgi:hypothetical protein